MLPSTGPKSNGGGPWESVKIALRLLEAAVLKLVSDRSCRARTGRFWVTTCPKLEPNTPMSKPATVTHAHNGLRIELISDAHARRQRLISICHIAVRADATVAGDSDQAIIQISKSTVALGVDSFREVDFPPQTVGKGKFGADAPGILTVEEPPLLAFCSAYAGAHVPLKLGDLPKKEGSHSETIGPRIPCTELIKKQQARAALIAGYAKVFSVADVRAELDGVVTLSSRPVIHHLKLLFAFCQWAIATGRVQTIAKCISAGIVVTQLTVHNRCCRCFETGIPRTLRWSAARQFPVPSSVQGIRAYPWASDFGRSMRFSGCT